MQFNNQIMQLSKGTTFIIIIIWLKNIFTFWNILWQLKSLTNHVISQKTFGQVFHSNEHKHVEKRYYVEKLISFERWQELCWRPLY
jgi:hypothetical protein